MGFAQAYYTSCEAGLSGFAGFQFNAATPGLAPQVLREIEALTSYEPPRALGYHPSAAEIASCPVNLVYRGEPTPVLANVVFVGLDSSQRLGNYFAHALIAQPGTSAVDGFDGILPIELWGSPLWASDPISARELPELSELPMATTGSDGEPRRPITRAGVDRFLAGRRTPDQLAALVTAAEDAVLNQGRSIVIIEPDNAAAAHWIAAISFLLPPEVARRMSFATYRHQPEYSDAHVIATLPDSDFEPGDSAAAGYVVFDAGSGRVSPVPPGPAAALLVRAGAARASELWERAAKLGEDGPTTLAGRYPALVAAALLDGWQLPATDLDVLSTWLEASGGQLPAGTRDELISRFLDAQAWAPQHLAGLAGLAQRGGDPRLGLRIEQAAVELELEGLTGADPGGADPDRVDHPARHRTDEAVNHGARARASASRSASGVLPVLTAAGREFAARRCADLLTSAPAAVAVPLLDWCVERRLTLPAGTFDRALLARIWPRGSWTPAEALTLTRIVRPADQAAEPIRDWLIRSVAEPPREGDYLPSYLLLARALADGALAEPLPAAAERIVSSFLTTAEELQRAAASGSGLRAGIVRRLAESYPEQPGPTQDLLGAELPAQLDALAGSPDLPAVVAALPEPITGAYLDAVHQRLTGDHADVGGAARIFESLQTLTAAADEQVAPALQEALRARLAVWPPLQLERLHAQLRRADPALGAAFAEFRNQHLDGKLRRSLRRLVRPGSRRR